MLKIGINFHNLELGFKTQLLKLYLELEFLVKISNFKMKAYFKPIFTIGIFKPIFRLGIVNTNRQVFPQLLLNIQNYEIHHKLKF